MLDNKIIKTICDFVYIKPRTIQEIAHLIGKNWRTADRYVDRIVEETGSICVRTFRGGTRGALKIVYWSNIEKIHSLEFQERLFTKIENASRKEDFSPFNIYQHVDKEMRRAYIVESMGENKLVDKDLFSFLQSAQKHILFFSGNLSWVNIVDGKKSLLNVLENLSKSTVVKVLTKIDITSHKNMAKLLKINERLGREAIEIRHCEQPLRGILVDGRMARFREVKMPRDYNKDEIDKETFIYYEVYEPEWVDWLEKVFWKLFRIGNLAKNRMESLESIENLY